MPPPSSLASPPLHLFFFATTSFLPFFFIFHSFSSHFPLFFTTITPL
ncbi:hypothetical protein F383_23736 [Gossypium arboreum]|uniref:Uncharacterized protein n=1 Tax=Gossypium arboreum TaxID=29729 RepID=A0A0B0MMH2_GOSAR|nr:hypothetical protein F383_23736 [Gossypium arboreum]